MKTWCDRLLQLGFTSLFTVVGLLIWELWQREQAIAQSLIEADETLGNERSVVIENFQGSSNEVIEGGARRGQNLFHSFREFNVNAERGAFFFSPDGVVNILSRVTGANPSAINGILGTFGIENGAFVSSDANLFLINPNGIIFGRGASLSIGGSFVATTADGIQFGDQGFFSATDPQVPSQLLSVDPSAFFFNQLTPGAIENQSTIGLQVPTDHSLLLLGGEVQLQSGKLFASSGRVEVGAVTRGSVGLTIDGDNLDLTFAPDLQFGDIFLAGSTLSPLDVLIDVSGVSAARTSGGEIQLQGDRISLTNASIQSNNFSDLPNGAISIQANQLELNNASVGTNSLAGSGGDIFVNANTIDIQNANGILTSSFGQGNAGNIEIRAIDSINLSNQSNIGSLFIGLPTVAEQGSSGNVLIKTRNFNVQNAGILVSSFIGQGNSGSLTVQADGSINLDNGRLLTSSLGASSSGEITIAAENLSIVNGSNIQTTAADPTLFNTTDLSLYPPAVITFIRTLLTGIAPGQYGQGDSGNITITANGTIRAASGSSIATSTRGQGQGGTLNITADSIELIGTSANGQLRSGLSSETTGAGDAGDLFITTGQLRILDGAVISTGAFSALDGEGGDLSINVTGSIELIGTSANGQFRSGLGSETNGAGDAGDVFVTAESLRVLDGAVISTGAFSALDGEGGDLSVNVTDSIELIGTSADGQFRSTLNSETTGVGDAGDVFITTGRLRIAEGAVISTGTFSAAGGRGGDLTIDAAESIELIGTTANGQFRSALSSETLGSGNAGNVMITTEQLRVLAGAGISASTFSSGRGGTLSINATESIELVGTTANGQFSSGLFSSTSNVGRAGNLRVETADLTVQNGAVISASTAGTGRGGNIRIIADSIELSGTSPNRLIASGVSSETLSPIENAGNAGIINLSAEQLVARNGAGISTSTFGQGNAGNIRTQIQNGITLDNRGFISSSVAAGAVGNGGNITLQTGFLSATGGGQITAIVGRERQQQGNFIRGGRGRGGSIEITALESIRLSGINSDGFSSGVFTLSERGANGPAGDIVLRTSNLQIAAGAIVVASTFNTGRGGNIEIEADSFEAIDGGQVVTSTRGQSQAGTITLNSNAVRLSGRDRNFQNRRDRARRYANQPGQSDRLSDVIVNQDAASGLFANTESGSSGDGGSITIDTTNLSLTDRALVSARSEGTGMAGDIEMNISELLTSTNSDIETIATNSSGGDITVQADRIQLYGDSDIRTSSRVNGGNITLSASSVLAFDDSDIIASAGKQGGDITLNTAAYFGENYQLETIAQEPTTLENNNRADINATGTQPGTISTPDTSFIQNSLTELPNTAIDTDSLLANSCVVRNQEQTGTFIITGPGGLPQRPGGNAPSAYPTAPVRSILDESSQEQKWQPGDPIVEPQGVYRLADGRMVLSRECSREEG